MTTAGAELRWLRAAVVAMVATSLGVAAHVMAGGLLPSWPGLVVILAAVMVVSAAALGRPASYGVIAGLVAGGQTGVHLLLTATSGHGSPHAPAASSGTMSPAPSALAPGSPVTAADGAGGYARLMRQVPSGVEGTGAPPHWVQHLLDDFTGLNGLMALGHLVAAALVSVWLWRGEQAVWGLMALLGAQVLSRIAMAWRSTPARMATLLRSARGMTSDAVSHVRALRSPVAGTTSRRGPPLGHVSSLLTSPPG